MLTERPQPKSEALTGVDCAWLRLDTPTNSMTVTALLVFDDPIDFDELRRVVVARLLPFRRFRQRVLRTGGWARPRWQLVDDFSLDAHLKRLTIVPGADLQLLVAQLLNDPLDPNEPLWDMHVVDGLPTGNALIVRIHHSVADGFSLVALMLSLVDADCEIALPSGPPPPRLDPAADLPPTGTPLARLRHHAGRAIEATRRLLADRQTLGWLSAGAPRVAHTVYELLTMAPDHATSLRGPLSGEKVVGWSQRHPLAALKEIARGYGGTINDLLLLALTGAFRQVLCARGEEPPSDAALRCVIPVNLRPLEYRTAALGNGFGLVWMPLPIGRASHAERFALIKERMDRIKRSPEAFVAYGTLAGVGRCPDAVQDLLVERFFAHRNTAVVTNMPGPSKPLRLAGKTISSQLFWVPQSAEVGVGVSIFSYAGYVQVGVLADRNLLAEPGELVFAFDAELAQLGQVEAG